MVLQIQKFPHETKQLLFQYNINPNVDNFEQVTEVSALIASFLVEDHNRSASSNQNNSRHLSLHWRQRSNS